MVEGTDLGPNPLFLQVIYFMRLTIRPNSSPIGGPMNFFELRKFARFSIALDGTPPRFATLPTNLSPYQPQYFQSPVANRTSSTTRDPAMRAASLRFAAVP